MRNLKKVIALVAVFAMLVSSVAFAQTFTDVDETYDYSEAIEMLSKLEILTGDDQDGDGRMDFRPEDTITRAEVAVVISRIQGMITVGQRATEFVDVPSTHWASGYVAQAAGQGIVNGYGDGNFGPEDPVLYEQAVKMLVETLGYAPFVADNGGYPNGHLTAASRYGILDGVKGGSVGAEATRGMVAQLVYNAIDTPLMDRWTYGADAEYVIYNGKGGHDYMSLLTRDLGAKKFSGIVTANEVTALDPTVSVEIDTEKEAKVSFNIDVNDDYDNYEIVDITGEKYESASAVDGEEGTVLLGEYSAMDMLGKHVNVFVQETDRNNEYKIISMAATTRNKTAEFTLDQYDSYDVTNKQVKYRKNETDRNATSLKLDTDVSVIYNGVFFKESSDLTKVFGKKGDVENKVLVVPNSKYSGKVTFIDNNSTNGYDVVIVDVASTAVVEEVDAKGRVNFKEAVENSRGKDIELTFNEEDKDTIINITKDGFPIEYTELAEWDVLSILYNADKADSNNGRYYEVKVVEGGKIEGSVDQKRKSETSAGGKDAEQEYRINGEWYDVAVGAYDAAKIDIGVSGTFYVDDYGKIVAYDKKGGSSVASDNYAFVIKAQAMPDNWGTNYNVQVLMLNKNGELIEASLASKVTIENATATGFTGDTRFDMTEKTDTEQDALAAELQGQLITYDGNSAGDIDEIVFATKSKNDNFFVNDKAFVANSSVEYDETRAKLGIYTITDDTVVFFINKESGADLTGDANGKVTGIVSDTASKVAGVASLKEGDYDFAAYNVTNKVPGAIVVLNSVGGVSPASSVAVIDEIGDAYVDGEKVLSVSFYQGGQLMTATADTDLDDSVLKNANTGDIWKFNLSADGSVITNAVQYFDFERDADIKKGGSDGTVKGDGFVAAAKKDQKFYFGPVVAYTSRDKDFEIAVKDSVDGDGNIVWDFTKKEYVTADSETNVYVYDPMMTKKPLSVGSAGSVDVDKDLVYDADRADKIKVDKDGKLTSDVVKESAKADEVADNTYAKAGDYPLGMLDFIAAVEYDGDVLDIVIYKAYDFGYWK